MQPVKKRVGGWRVRQAGGQLLEVMIEFSDICQTVRTLANSVKINHQKRQVKRECTHVC
jgi:hypothetical protein